MPKVISIEEERIRRAICNAEKQLQNTRTLISYGDYDRVAEALELEELISALENRLINLIERDFNEAYAILSEVEED
jgi:predicted esterase